MIGLWPEQGGVLVVVIDLMRSIVFDTLFA